MRFAWQLSKHGRKRGWTSILLTLQPGRWKNLLALWLVYSVDCCYAPTSISCLHCDSSPLSARKTLSSAAASDLCAAFQDVAFSHLEDRIKRALDYVEDQQINVTALVVVGGVAANRELRRWAPC